MFRLTSTCIPKTQQRMCSRFLSNLTRVRPSLSVSKQPIPVSIISSPRYRYSPSLTSVECLLAYNPLPFKQRSFYFRTAIFIISHALNNVLTDVTVEKILTCKRTIHFYICAIFDMLFVTC